MRALFFAMVCTLAAANAAMAHAFLDHAEPKVGSTVAVPPGEVKLWFTEPLIAPFSDVKVTDAIGREVEKRDKHVDATNGQLLVVSVQPLAPGKYVVAWRVTATDTHVTQGKFEFTVKP